MLMMSSGRHRFVEEGGDKAGTSLNKEGRELREREKVM